MVRRLLRQIRVCFPASVLTVIGSITMLVLVGITYWYHSDGIRATYEVSGSLITALSYIYTLLVGLPIYLSWPVTIGLVGTIILMQINTWLLICYRRAFANAVGSKRSSAVGLSGFIAGLFGVGCSVCGTTLLVGIFGTIGSVPLIALLPWHGTELLFIGMIIMLGTTLFLLRQLAQPRVCV